MAATRCSLPVRPVTLRVGDARGPETIGPLTRTDIVRFAGAGGDFNPLHHDEIAARDAGFDSIFAMGMFPATIVGTRLAGWVGPMNIRKLSFRFEGLVWPGDELSLTAEVEDVRSEFEGDIASISMMLLNGEGEAAISGRALVLVADSDSL